MKINIDGEELEVRKSTIAVDAWQRQSGHGLAWISEEENQIYGPAFAAFCALATAGKNPSWDELIRRDMDDFKVVAEPGDERPTPELEVPPSLPAASEEAAGGEPIEAESSAEQSDSAPSS